MTRFERRTSWALSHSCSETIEATARAQGKSSLREHALVLAAEGIISLDEALRVTVAEA